MFFQDIDHSIRSYIRRVYNTTVLSIRLIRGQINFKKKPGSNPGQQELQNIILVQIYLE
jgi:hypothetical protein